MGWQKVALRDLCSTLEMRSAIADGLVKNGQSGKLLQVEQTRHERNG
jgi:hypothetical protein